MSDDAVTLSVAADHDRSISVPETAVAPVAPPNVGVVVSEGVRVVADTSVVLLSRLPASSFALTTK